MRSVIILSIWLLWTGRVPAAEVSDDCPGDIAVFSGDKTAVFYRRPPYTSDDALTNSYIRRAVQRHFQNSPKQPSDAEVVALSRRLVGKIRTAMVAAMKGDFETADSLLGEVKKEHPFEIRERPERYGGHKTGLLRQLLEVGGARGEATVWSTFQLETGSTTAEGGNGANPIDGVIHFARIEMHSPDGGLITDPKDPVARAARLKNVVTASEEMLHGLDDILLAYGETEGVLANTWATRHWGTYYGLAEKSPERRGGISGALGEGAIGVLLLEANREAGGKMPAGFLEKFIASYDIRKGIQRAMAGEEPPR